MSEIVPPTFVLMRPDSASRWISATHAGAAASNGSRDIGQRSRGRSHSVIMQNLSIVRFEFATKFGRAIASACSLVFACSLITVQGIPLQASPWQTAAPAPGGSAPQATQNSDGFAKPQLSSTFTDARTGQLYGRYIIYETVPVVAYQHQEVTEQQWVPEWVTEEKLMAQTNYIPVVTYQLQLQTERSMNPFAQPKQYWQYVPVVQYQPNFTQVKQPVTYQKYVQKEVKKSIPVLVSQSQPRPKFVDMPLQGNGTLAPGSSQIAGSASVQQPVPTRPSIILCTPPRLSLPFLPLPTIHPRMLLRETRQLEAHLLPIQPTTHNSAAGARPTLTCSLDKIHRQRPPGMSTIPQPMAECPLAVTTHPQGRCRPTSRQHLLLDRPSSGRN